MVYFLFEHRRFMREKLPELARGNPQIEFKLEERFNKHPHILGEYGM